MKRAPYLLAAAGLLALAAASTSDTLQAASTKARPHATSRAIIKPAPARHVSTARPRPTPLSKPRQQAPKAPASPTAAPVPLPIPTPSMPTADAINNATLEDKGVKDGVGPAVLRAQIMLDRLHASPGVIDGRDGSNFVHALVSFEKSRNLPPLTVLNPKAWVALLAGSGGPVIVEHVLSDNDVAGPFFPDLPKDYGELAKLTTIGYRNVSQKLGAQFHMGEDLLASLNPGVDLSKPGTRILVAAIEAPSVRGVVQTVVVDKKTSQVLAFDRRGHILAAYPATIGSRELPSPSGSYRIRGVAFNPIYYYDPDKNFVQGDNKEKLKLPAGPNNPVGSVFIALTKPTYGLHGTPDPSKIDKTVSHGCVRMTNWDATELAHLVRPGMVVTFRW